MYAQARQQTPSIPPLIFNGTSVTLDDDAESGSVVTRQDSWLVSFIDILILLVTLFVLLLTYQEDTTDRIRQHSADSVPATAVAAEPFRTAPALPLLLSAPDSTATVFNIEEELRAPSLNRFDSIGVPSKSSPAAQRQSGPDNSTPAPSDAGDPKEQPLNPADSNSTADASTEGQEQQAAPLAGSAGTKAATGQGMEDFLNNLRDSDLRDRVEVRAHGAGVHLEIVDSIVFAPASAELTPGGIALLERLAEALNSASYHLSVEGHTDSTPIATAHFPSNWELSTARAATVARYLVKRGIAAGRVRAIGYADTRPRADNLTPEGRSRNRRVSLILQSPSG